MERKIIHVVGTGTIGEPLIGLLCDYKEQLALSTHPGVQLGAVAQELETVAPRCVKSDLRGVKTVNTDELFWHMINSIKELSAENTALKARLDAAGI